MRTMLAGILVASGLAVSACGESEPPIILNTEKIERAIEQSSFTQRQRRVRVSCPAGVHQRKGLEFSCVTISTRRSTRFVVTQLDDTGRVRYEAP